MPTFAEAHVVWSAEPSLLATAAAGVALYLCGFSTLHRVAPRRFPPRRCAAFLAGVALVLLALASPLDAAAEELLCLHMTQHLLLMGFAPPLLWLGSPLAPLLLGLPPPLRRPLVQLLSRPRLRGLGRVLAHPVTCWLVFVIALWTWHVPSLYERALADERWHDAEHLCFLAAGLLFWWPIVRPWPSHPRWPRLILLPYLVLCALQNTVFSALFTFADRVIYPHYARTAEAHGLAPLTDQALAGAVMWIPGSLVMLAPAIALMLEHLDGARGGARR